MKEFFKKHKKELRQVGEIITIFNRIENVIVIYLTILFSSLYDKQERYFLINDTLNDVNIFQTFNQKVNFLEKSIKRVSMIATKRKKTFNEKKYLTVCKSIRKIQEYRNKIAHMPLAFSLDGKAIIIKRKTDKEMLINKSEGSFNREELDLKKIKKQVWEVYKKAEKILAMEGATRSLNILLEEELNISTILNKIGYFVNKRKN